jgi:haloalkane dehalogenase
MEISHKEYPFKGKFLKIDGLNYHYLDEGSGDPIVMVHGNPTWSFYFRNAVKDLSKNYRTIVPDHIGCGFSDKPDDKNYEFTLERRIDDLEKLLDSLNVKNNITLMVHDWGGMIGMGLAARHPDRIRRLIITNTAAFHLPVGLKFPTTLKICRNKTIGPMIVQGLNAFVRGAARFCVAREKLKPAARAAYMAPYDSWQNRRAVYHFVQDIPLVPTDRSYATVSKVELGLDKFSTVPTLICWGAKDFIFDDKFLDSWRMRFPSAEVCRFADAGHYLFEDAWPDVKPKILAFLAR